MAIKNDALLAAIDAGRENSYGSDEKSSLGKKRAKAIEYYLGLNTNPASEGRSQVVDRSVYETIHVILPSLVRIFAGSSDEVCKATAIGPDDEPAAEQQTAVLNYVVTQQNQWEQVVSDWIHDACLLSNGYAMAYWDESEQSIREEYEGQSEDQVVALMMDQGVQVVQHSESQDIDENGQPLHDLVIERKENEGKVCIQVLPPEHCRVSMDTPDWTLKDCPFFEFRQQKTIADLRAMGLEVPEDISDSEEKDDDDEEDRSRDRFGEDRDDDTNKGVMRRVWASMIWVRADAEEDGSSRLYYVIAVGRTVLLSQTVSRIPVASMTPQPMPHRHIGMAIGEVVHDIQDIKTAVKRGGLDNLYLANNGRHLVSSKVSLEDMLDSRPGGVVRMLDDSMPSDGHIFPLVHPFAFDTIIGSLEYFDQDRQNRTGASRYFSGTDAGAINKTASGTMALQNMASMRIEHIARMMAPAVEALFSAVQEIIAKHRNKPLTIKLRGQWVTVDPQTWRTKRDLRISVGVGAGNKDMMLQQLMQQLQVQMGLIPLGLAGREQIHATVTEHSKLSGFANPARFWVDPTQTPPPPPPQDPQMVKVQLDAQAKQAELQFKAQDAQLERQKSEAEFGMKVREAELDVEKAKVELQIKLAELELKREELALKQQDQQLKAEGAQIDAALKVETTRHQMQKDAVDSEREERRMGLEHSHKSREAGLNTAVKDRELALKERDSERQGGLEERKASLEEKKVDREAKRAKDTTQDIAATLTQVLEGSKTVSIERVRDAKGKLIGARRTLANGKTEEVPIQ